MQFTVTYSRLKEIPNPIPKDWYVNGGSPDVEVLEFRYSTSLTLRTPVVVVAYGGDNGYVIYNLLHRLKQVFSAEQYKVFERILLSDDFWQWYVRNDTVMLWRTKL
jgi:hypothetical protein